MNATIFDGSGARRRPATAFVLLTLLAMPRLARGENKFLQHNLVSDLPGIADHTDPALINPWGISSSATSPFWISNNHTGLAKIYDSQGKPAALIVSVPAAGSGTSSPTGQVFNGTSGFVLGGVKPAQFLFATEDGTISGWYNGIPNNNAVVAVDRSGSGAVYKGLAIGASGVGPLLYAADFHGGAVDVFDADFSPVAMPGKFSDPGISQGFAPFNVAFIEGKVYVAYAKQDEEKHDDLPGAGNGYVDVFDADGNMLQRLISGDRLNSPWAMLAAPDGFGDFGKALLVGNFGDGTINAFNSSTGAFLGTLQDTSGKPISISGLWALQFGNGGSGGDANALYFTAGIAGPQGEAIESHGLFGSIQATPAIDSNGVVNGAGFQSVIAPNGWVTIFGKNLAATTRSWQTSDFLNGQLPMELDGVSVTIGGKAAYVAFVSPKQLNVLAPGGASSGSAVVTASNHGLASPEAPAQIQAVAPAFFKIAKYAIATHADGNSLVGPESLVPGKTSPAKAGEVVVLYGSGFGQSTPPLPEGQVVNSPSTLQTAPMVLIDGTPAEVLFAGLTATGLYQINIKVPAGVASGDVRIVAVAGGVRSPDGVFIAIDGSQPTATPPPTPDPVYSASIDNFQFMPANITVAVGGKLTWTNKQATEHTVRSDSGAFGSAVLGESDAFSFTFANPGTYAYHCSIHPFMNGTVVVQ